MINQIGQFNNLGFDLIFADEFFKREVFELHTFTNGRKDRKGFNYRMDVLQFQYESSNANEFLRCIHCPLVKSGKASVSPPNRIDVSESGVMALQATAS